MLAASIPALDMYVAHEAMQTITRLRQEQGVIDGGGGWDEAFEYSDPGGHGVLNTHGKRGAQPPVIGVDVEDRAGKVVGNLEVAWPNEGGWRGDI